jgi:hypothetical protein
LSKSTKAKGPTEKEVLLQLTQLADSIVTRIQGMHDRNEQRFSNIGDVFDAIADDIDDLDKINVLAHDAFDEVHESLKDHDAQLDEQHERISAAHQRVEDLRSICVAASVRTVKRFESNENEAQQLCRKVIDLQFAIADLRSDFNDHLAPKPSLWARAKEWLVVKLDWGWV